MGEAKDLTALEHESVNSRIRLVRRHERDLETAIIFFLYNY